MRGLIVMMLIGCLSSTFVLAEEVGLLANKTIAIDAAVLVKEKKGSLSKPVVAVEHPLVDVPNEMDAYIREEEGRIKDIKLLSLDLEKANIQLKRKEIESKMAELNKTNAPTLVTMPQSLPSGGVLLKRLTALTVSGDFKEATININGVSMMAHEGDAVGEAKVATINAQGVDIIYPNGKKEKLTLNL